MILDASALLALVFKEVGHEKVAAHMASAALSSVNALEVCSKLKQRGFSDDTLRFWMSGGMLRIIAFTAQHAYDAAQLHASLRGKNLSYADCACLALARQESLPVLTADRLWAKLDVGVKVELLR